MSTVKNCSQSAKFLVTCISWSFSTVGYPSTVPFILFLQGSTNFLRFLFPLRHSFHRISEFVELQESRVNYLYFTVLLFLHENQEHLFPLKVIFPLSILHWFLSIAWNQTENELPSSCVLNKHITNAFQELAGQSVLYLFSLIIRAEG